MSFRRDDAALALQPFGSLLSLIDKDLAANEREVRHPRRLVGHGGFSRGTTPVKRRLAAALASIRA